jgi:DinB superfamily
MGTEPKSQEALRDFDAGRQALQGALERVPEGALAYLKPGDDYALGGLVYHVNFVLENYLNLLRAVLSAESGDLRLPEPRAAHEEANRKAKIGLQPGELHPLLERMDDLHSQVRAVAGPVPDAEWDREVTVHVGDTAPYQASPAAVMGWLIGHYDEHIPQTRQLQEEWEASSRPG